MQTISFGVEEADSDKRPEQKIPIGCNGSLGAENVQIASSQDRLLGNSSFCISYSLPEPFDFSDIVNFAQTRSHLILSQPESRANTIHSDAREALVFTTPDSTHRMAPGR